MSFDSYLNQSWNDHATQTLMVAASFESALLTAETDAHLSKYAGLVTHVMGEHLGQWEKGIQLLSQIKNHKAFIKDSETHKAIDRSILSLKIGAGENVSLNLFSVADQVRIMMVSSSSLAEKNTPRAHELFVRALDLAEKGLDNQDTANRSIAITGNNLASTLEEKPNRTKIETELMVLAAKTARKYWEIAGGPTEVSRAEYRLAKTCIQSKDLASAFSYAQVCIQMCLDHSIGDFDLFYGYECLADVEKHRQNKVGFESAIVEAKKYFEKLSEEDKSWCEASLKKLY